MNHDDHGCMLTRFSFSLYIINEATKKHELLLLLLLQCVNVACSISIQRQENQCVDPKDNLSKVYRQSEHTHTHTPDYVRHKGRKEDEPLVQYYTPARFSLVSF